MNALTKKTVATPSKDAARNVQSAQLPRTLMGGTDAMRAADKTYLPKEPAELPAAYDARKARSVLFNAFGKTVDDMTGKVFAKAVVVKDDVPAQIKGFVEDIDLTGRHLNVFARDAFHDAMQPGVGFILTDMPPKVERLDGAPATLADEQKAGIRPYLVYIPVERLIGWQSKAIGGVPTLTQVRILEYVSEPDGEFDEKDVEQVRVIDAPAGDATDKRCLWRTFRMNAEKEWVEHGRGFTSLPKITLTAFYTNRVGFMLGKSPLAKLADLNVAHWQLDSDISNITHYANVPILFASGYDPKEAKLEISSAGMFYSNNPQAKLSYVEHSGAAIGVAVSRLKDIEFRMQTMGLQLLIPQPGGKTATGEHRDDVKENSPLAMMATNLQDAIEVSFGFMAEYLGLGAGAGGSVVVNKDFGIQAGALADVSNILTAYSNGVISLETAIDELKRRGFLSDSVDAETEKGRIETAAPELGTGKGAGKKMDLDA